MTGAGSLIAWIDSKVKETHGHASLDQFDNGQFWAFKEVQQYLRQHPTPDLGGLVKVLEAEKAPYHESDNVGRNSNLTVDRCIAALRNHFAESKAE